MHRTTTVYSNVNNLSTWYSHRMYDFVVGCTTIYDWWSARILLHMYTRRMIQDYECTAISILRIARISNPPQWEAQGKVRTQSAKGPRWECFHRQMGA